jgi:hypothetical protein
MTKTPLLAALILTLAFASCTENKPPQSEPAQAQLQPQPRVNPFLQDLQQAKVSYSPNLAQSGQPQPAAPMGANQPLSLQNTAVAPAAPPKPTEPPITIPPDAKWTLYITSVATPDRFSTMQQLKTTLAAQTPFKKWYVVHGEQESSLFYGFYSEFSKTDRDGKPNREGLRAQAEMEQIKTWQNQAGHRPFAAAFFTPVTAPDPVAPPEWNLLNAPATAFWSLQIGAYQGDPRRKQFAVDAVKEARAKGLPAYYYHGSTISSVTIGTWPMKSVKEQESDGSHADADPDSAVLVTNMPLSYKLRPNQSTDRQGQRLEFRSQRVEIEDPTLLAAMKEYPYHLVNGVATKRQGRTRDGTVKDVISPSFLVIIPREETGGLANNANENSLFGNPGAGTPQGKSSARPPTSDPYGQSAPAGAGKLRGLK